MDTLNRTLEINIDVVKNYVRINNNVAAVAWLQRSYPDPSYTTILAVREAVLDVDPTNRVSWDLKWGWLVATDRSTFKGDSYVTTI